MADVAETITVREAHDGPSAALAAFAAGVDFDDIPTLVVARAADLFVDWFGSALAGRSARAVQTIVRFAAAMGPHDGQSELLIERRTTTPYFAAMVNAAASHVVEQDDVHNGSVFHPATVVFPVALAIAQATGASGRALIEAATAGYEVGIRIGEYLGRPHYRIFHTTGTVGTVAAAATAGRLLGLDAKRMLDAFGSAGTQAAGLWEFLRDAADSKQLHTAHAASAGLASAYLARSGLTGARRILEGAQGMAAGMTEQADAARLVDGLGSRWALSETSFKYHAACRHTHPAADALLDLMQRERLEPDAIERVVAEVHQGAIDVLGAVGEPTTVHQAKFSMGTVLGLIAHGGRAGLGDFERALKRPEVAAFRQRVQMVLDPEVDAAYPERWIGKVTVHLKGGGTLAGRVDEPKGDPGNSLTREEIETKFRSLAAFGGDMAPAELDRLLPKLWGIAEIPVLSVLLQRAS